jgi:integrase
VTNITHYADFPWSSILSPAKSNAIGRTGRPSKSLTFAQAEAVLKAAEQRSIRMRAYIVVSLLIGARTEEMRAIRRHDVTLVGQPHANPPRRVMVTRVTGPLSSVARGWHGDHGSVQQYRQWPSTVRVFESGT